MVKATYFKQFDNQRVDYLRSFNKNQLSYLSAVNRFDGDRFDVPNYFGARDCQGDPSDN